MPPPGEPHQRSSVRVKTPVRNDLTPVRDAVTIRGMNTCDMGLFESRSTPLFSVLVKSPSDKRAKRMVLCQNHIEDAEVFAEVRATGSVLVSFTTDSGLVEQELVRARGETPYQIALGVVADRNGSLVRFEQR
jgi:hypothetical protein